MDKKAIAGQRKRQWLWFIGLWCGGLLAVLLLSGLIKLIFSFT